MPVCYGFRLRLPMTETEWLACTDLWKVLRHLRGRRGQCDRVLRNLMDRKLRLFACACCRRIWHLMPNEYSKTAVEVAELFADGLVNGRRRYSASRFAEGNARILGYTHMNHLQ